MSGAANGLRAPSDRQAYLDGARGFVILLMLVGHASPPARLMKWIYGFHMPFFFLLSGYLFNAEKYASMRFAPYCKKRFATYMIPYCVYAVCNLIVNIPVEIHNGIVGKALLVSTAKHIFWLLYGAGDKKLTPNCTPLWFLPCLFLCCLLFYLLLRIPKQPLRWAICALFFGVSVLLSELHARQMPWHIDTALLGTFYMQIGFAAKKLRFPQRVPLPFLVALAAAALGFFCIDRNGSIDMNSLTLHNPAYMLVGSLCVNAAIFLVFYKLYSRGRILVWLGRNTMPIFAFNFAVNAYLRWIWALLFPNRALTWWLLTLLDVPCCVGIVLLHNAVRNRRRKLRGASEKQRLLSGSKERCATGRANENADNL